MHNRLAIGTLATLSVLLFASSFTGERKRERKEGYPLLYLFLSLGTEAVNEKETWSGWYKYLCLHCTPHHAEREREKEKKRRKQQETGQKKYKESRIPVRKREKWTLHFTGKVDGFNESIHRSRDAEDCHRTLVHRRALTDRWNSRQLLSLMFTFSLAHTRSNTRSHRASHSGSLSLSLSPSPANLLTLLRVDRCDSQWIRVESERRSCESACEWKCRIKKEACSKEKEGAQTVRTSRLFSPSLFSVSS